ncbi:T9SS type A sorting domain-containing protein [Psychroserpens sp. MEBiC05023]
MKSPKNLRYAFGISRLCKNFIFCLILISSLPSLAQLAFPTATGAGANVTGGRGGTVYHVTNLNNSGSGSFRDAVSGSNRIIVFDVSGTIELTSSLYITADNLTIAGQSAPEGGITITGNVVHFQNTDNIIVRYLRFRPNYNSSGNVDALNAYNCTNFIADHCSVSWGGDEAFSLRGSSSDVTVQNCIFGESATGMLAGESSNANSTNFSINSNLWYNISHRFPNVNAIRTDVINNVVHNWYTRLKVVASRDHAQLNEINNYYQSGTKTGEPRSPNWSVNWLDIGSSSQRSNIRIYSDGNVYPSFLTEDEDDWSLYVHRFNVTGGAYAGTNQWDDGNTDFKVSTPFGLLGETTNIMTAEEALASVPLNSGACKYLNSDGSTGEFRDAIDETYVTNVVNGTSESYSYPPTNITSKASYVNFHNSVSSTPINSRPSSYDTDNDGMADDWEIIKYNTLTNSASGDENGDGYTNIEEFLNEVDTPSTNGSQVTVNSNATNDTICEGEEVVLTAANADSYVWNNGATTQSITITPSITDNYTVTGTHSDGSETEAVITITVNDIPTANAGDDVEICQGTGVTLTATGGTSYLWNTGETTQSISVNPNVTTVYSVEVTQNNCTSTDSVIVTVNEIPNVDAGEDVTIFIGESATLTATGADSYLWSTGETTQSITVNPTLSTSYSVTGTTNNCESSDTVTVFLQDDSVNANAGADTEICIGETTTLTATGGTTYLWSTGETTPSISVSPTITTTYTVTAYSASGANQEDDSVVVTVNELPVADAGTDVSTCFGDTVTLTASGGSTYLWNTGETTQSIIVNPNQTTTFSVEVFENNCSDTDQVIVTVNPTPDVNAGSNVTIDQGNSTTLTATGADSYLWSTGETNASITVSPNSTTTYNVTGTSNGCEADANVTVVVQTETIIANAGTDVTICNGESTTLTASGGTTYLWNTGETTQSINVSPSSTTTYTVTVFSSSGNTSDEDSVIVTVNELPNTDAGSNVTISEGESTNLTATGAESYLWNNGATTATITVTPNSTTTYSVTGFSNNCESTDDITVTVNIENVTANAGTDVTICNGESTTLTASGGTTYLWNTGQTTQSINVNPNTTTTYTVTAFNAAQTASDEDSVIVTVTELPLTNAGNDITIVEGESTTLTATGAETYIWNTGATTASITVSPNSTTTYSVTGISNNCEFTDEVIVTVEPFEFEASAGADQAICQGYSTTLTASEGDAYLWSTGETTQSITVSPTGTQTYTVTVFEGEYQDDDEVTVSVNPNPNVIINDNGEVMMLEGEFVTLSATGANSYLWNNGATQPNIAVSPSATTTYEVTGFINDCEDTSAIVVNVFETVEADAGEDIIICSEETVTLTATGGDEYLWNTGETTQSIEVSPDTDTEYSVLVYNALDSDEDTVVVFVDQCNTIEVNPEDTDEFGFVLYQDPVTDVLKVKINGLQSVTAKGVTIYDLSGKVLFTELFDPSELEDQSEMTREINTTLFSRGIYVARLLYDDTSVIKKIPIR